MAEFRMPSLGADMAAGRLLEWLKQPGDPVERGDIIAEVDTDKGVIEVEVFTTGVIDRLLVQPGEKVPVGTVLAIIRDAQGETHAPAEQPAPPQPAPAALLADASLAEPGSRLHGGIRASPLARRVAADLGVDLAAVRGSGSEGAITRADVEAAARAVMEPAAERPADRSAARMRRAIAAAMARSKREIPHYYLSHRVNMGPTTAWLTEQNRDRSAKERLLLGAVYLRALAVTLHDFPELNAWWEKGVAGPKERVHVGVGITLRGGGLVAPALHDVDSLTLPEVSARLRELVTRARGGTLRSSELTDATITITALGDRGVDAVFGIIYPPQVALVGVGTVRETPWVVGGGVAVQPVATLSLAADHRASDGHRGSLFLSAVADRLQEPETL